ncbi:alpha/beta hydrolase family protein [Nonomuraea jiangxiensis]|uniref:Platelet-activating factor acetylhydrolase, isoform II n=1 Tax=Nonomuraea jiangxiensis TaxID=633440 RepID=A0A1G7ZXZ2_9ACTN|nr:hypothetical protein [Nonomuraea jiangxiensis]SDH13481.1 Platelet-activating factor acetylhydrolase, isoform II [Nonomuraea jiangxiensis]
MKAFPWPVGGRTKPRLYLWLWALALAGLIAVNLHLVDRTVAWASAPADFRLSLPAPSGPHKVGTAVLRLVQDDRPDPWRSGRPREILLQLWYPTAEAGAPAAYLGEAAARHMAARYGFPPAALANLPTHASLGAPVAAGRRPVLLFSPGDGGNRTDNTALTQELASHGYVVVALDHPGDGLEVQRLDGSLIERSKPEPADPDAAPHLSAGPQVAVRVADLRAVLDALARPDRFQGRVPAGLATALDLGRVGAFGHSLGGATAAQAAAEDPRVDAAADLDGLVAGPVATKGLDKPFLILRSPWHTPERDPSWATFLPALRGWHRVISVTGAGHYAFADLGLWAARARLDLRMGRDTWATNFGDRPGPEATAVIRQALVGFFDSRLRGAPVPPILDREAI